MIPKGIIGVTMPIIQVTFTVAAGLRDKAALQGAFVLKGLAATVVLAGVIALIAAFYPALCGGNVGVRLCEPTVMTPLLMGAVVLCALRVLVLIRLAERYHGITYLLLVPVISMPMLTAVADLNMERLAEVYVAVVSAAFVIFSFLFVLTSRHGRTS